MGNLVPRASPLPFPWRGRGEALGRRLRKFARVCSCSISQLKSLLLCLGFVFTFRFQGHTTVAPGILHV